MALHDVLKSSTGPRLPMQRYNTKSKCWFEGDTTVNANSHLNVYGILGTKPFYNGDTPEAKFYHVLFQCERRTVRAPLSVSIYCNCIFSYGFVLNCTVRGADPRFPLYKISILALCVSGGTAGIDASVLSLGEEDRAPTLVTVISLWHYFSPFD